MKVAIYSRKSKFTGKGDSIGNQIQMCKDYIENLYKNKEIEYSVYEDEGFSVKNTNRPEFQKLLNDIKKEKFNILICYRLDRISRNVAGFSSTLDELQAYGVDFVSIREQFDTTSPMGRAMIYIASVFAQLERETIAERVRDNMIELAKNGQWLGGTPPLGYDRRRESFFSAATLHKVLKNPLYVKSSDAVLKYRENDGINVFGTPDGIHGILNYNRTSISIRNGKKSNSYKDKSEWIASVSKICKGFIEHDIWLEVQKQINTNKFKAPNLGNTNNAILTGKLICGSCRSHTWVIQGHINKDTSLPKIYYKCNLKNVVVEYFALAKT